MLVGAVGRHWKRVATPVIVLEAVWSADALVGNNLKGGLTLTDNIILSRVEDVESVPDGDVQRVVLRFAEGGRRAQGVQTGVVDGGAACLVRGEHLIAAKEHEVHGATAVLR